MSQCLSFKLETQLNPSKSPRKLYSDGEQISACHIFFIQAPPVCPLIGCALIILALFAGDLAQGFYSIFSKLKMQSRRLEVQMQLIFSLCLCVFGQEASTPPTHCLFWIVSEWVLEGGRRNRCNWMSQLLHSGAYTMQFFFQLKHNPIKCLFTGNPESPLAKPPSSICCQLARLLFDAHFTQATQTTLSWAPKTPVNKRSTGKSVCWFASGVSAANPVTCSLWCKDLTSDVWHQPEPHSRRNTPKKSTVMRNYTLPTSGIIIKC